MSLVEKELNSKFSYMAFSLYGIFHRNKEDKEVRRPEHGKLAVLTGVISRSTIVIVMGSILYALSLSWEPSSDQPISRRP